MDNRPTIAEVQEWVLKLYNTYGAQNETYIED